MHFGSHSLQPKSRLVPINRMAAPKTVVIPGIDTGTMKTIARKAMSSNKPSCPTISLISASETPLVGKLPVMTFSFSPRETVVKAFRPPDAIKYSHAKPQEISLERRID
jgi:hypothetical protein